MRKFFCILSVLVLFPVISYAGIPQLIDFDTFFLDGGDYVIGRDLPAGSYRIYPAGSDEIVYLYPSVDDISLFTKHRFSDILRALEVSLSDGNIISVGITGVYIDRLASFFSISD